MSIRKAVNDKCKDCIYDPKEPGTWTMQVEKCNDKTCPLWIYRPLTQSTKDKIKRIAYKKMTPEQQAKVDKKAADARERFRR